MAERSVMTIIPPHKTCKSAWETLVPNNRQDTTASGKFYAFSNPFYTYVSDMLNKTRTKHITT